MRSELTSEKVGIDQNVVRIDQVRIVQDPNCPPTVSSIGSTLILIPIRFGNGFDNLMCYDINLTDFFYLSNDWNR